MNLNKVNFWTKNLTDDLEDCLDKDFLTGLIGNEETYLQAGTDPADPENFKI